MSKFPIVLISILLFSSLVVIVGVTLNPLEKGVAEAKLYTYPLSVGEKTYIVTIGSNYSSAPTVNLPQVPANIVEFDFRGPPEDTFCNITIPNDLIWGKLTVIDKYYVMDKANYVQTSNSTDTSIYFTFNHITHIALDKHFEIRGTEGVIA
ncbi:MAG: hypothetical protein P8Y18_09160 [Candidatus Bathyarchaeota archaeon]